MVTPTPVRILAAAAAVLVLIQADADLAVRALAAIGTWTLGCAAWAVIARTAPAETAPVPLDLTGRLRRATTANGRTPSPCQGPGRGRPTQGE